jgi:hypothetical protein
MALDVVRVFYEHLVNIGKTKKIDLFIFSAGGNTIVPWRLVNLIREFCEEFCVLIPYKAHSAATLMALGANEIIMGPMAELSPIDPNIGTPFNPPSSPENPNSKIDISVEDVAGFLNLAQELVGISDQDNLTQVLDRLALNIHPLALGAVYRSHALIRLLATKLLELHMTEAPDRQRIPKIVDDLAEKLYYHNYLISRSEAKELGLRVKKPNSDLERLLWSLYLDYEAEMELGKPFDPAVHLREEDSSEIQSSIAVIESQGLYSHFDKCITLQRLPDQKTRPRFAAQEISFGWHTQVDT